MKYFSAIAALFAVTMFSGSGTLLNAAAKKLVAPISIDEKNIVNKTGGRASDFAPLIDTVKTELVQAGYVVVDMHDLGKAIEFGGIVDAVNGTDSADIPLEFPGYIIRISVIKYGHSNLTRRDVARGSQNVVNAEVAISAHIVKQSLKDKKSGLPGQTVGSCMAEARKTITVSGDGRGNFKEGLLGDCNIRVARKLIRELENYIPSKFRPQPPKVYQVKGSRVILYSAGRRWAPGCILDVYDVEVIGEDDEEEVIQGDFAGRVRVVKSTEKYTICELLSNGIGIKKGMLAYPPAPAAPAAPQAQPQAQPQPQWGNAPF